jgi:hypothetical protein
LRQIAGRRAALPQATPEGPLDVELLAPLDPRLEMLVTEMLWWTRALATARTGVA